MAKFRSVPITVRLEQEALGALDEAAAKEDRGRSQLVRIMIREGLAKRAESVQ